MEKLRKLTQMAEHPEQYSDKEWQEIFEGETISQEQIDLAWQRFEKEHPHRPNRSILKRAASFVGILLLSGIAVAAILHTTKPETPVTETTKTEVRTDNETSPATTASVQEPHTVIFENTELQQIIDSLHRLAKLPDETVVLPGHGPQSTIGDEKRYNPYMRS